MKPIEIATHLMAALVGRDPDINLDTAASRALDGAQALLSQERSREAKRRAGKARAAGAARNEMGLFQQTPSEDQGETSTEPAGENLQGFQPGATVPLWEAYADEYSQVYGIAPIRNKSVNSCLKVFLERVGAHEAPSVLRHYVKSQNSLYVGAGHPVELAVRDASKLRTEWATGTSITRSRAAQVDRRSSNGQIFNEVISDLERKNAGVPPSR